MTTDPLRWPFKYRDCAGRFQSPINFNTREVLKGKKNPPFQFYQYDSVIPMVLTNNGHSGSEILLTSFKCLKSNNFETNLQLKSNLYLTILKSIIVNFLQLLVEDWLVNIYSSMLIFIGATVLIREVNMPSIDKCIQTTIIYFLNLIFNPYS